MYPRKNGRVTFRTNRRSNFKRNNTYSNGKVRNKGNLVQQYQKYTKLAKEAFSSGDRIQTEYYYQFADHYSRLMIELGIVFDDNANDQTTSESKSSDQKIENKNKSDENVSESKEKNNGEISDTIEENEEESIESVPFISQPAKKKSLKTKKSSE